MKRILIASSTAAFRERNRNLLKRTDFAVLSAATGAEARAVLRDGAIDLVLAEMQLDDMGGDELCLAARAEDPTRRMALVLVCHDRGDELERAGRCGADAWLTRPVQPLQLLETVELLLRTVLVRSRRVSLRVQVESRTDGRTFTCRSHNLSVTGILLETAESLADGSPIACRFQLPDSCLVEARGTVVRSESPVGGVSCYGIGFHDLAPEFAAAIASFIAAG